MSNLPALTLLASRYEAVDQRLLDRHVDDEISIGDFVVSGGELPAMLLIDALVRLLPGALNDPRSALGSPSVPARSKGRNTPVPEVFEGTWSRPCCCPGIMPGSHDGAATSPCG